MSIHVPAGFAAREQLAIEGCRIATGPSRRSFRIGLLNLMPKKEDTERQFARMLCQTETPIEMVLLHMACHESRNCGADYLRRLYHPADHAALETLDGIIVTGAPVEQLHFTEVDYWREFVPALDFIRNTGLPALFICWAAQAALYRYYGIAKRPLLRKAFGVFPQHIMDGSSDMARGLGPVFPTPVSRHTTVCDADILRNRQLRLIAASNRTGPALIDERDGASCYMFNHLEYEHDTLEKEYHRDLACGESNGRPLDHAMSRIGTRIYRRSWAPAANRFYTNWAARIADSRKPCIEAGPARESAS
jgi:homoserine O-succinyltransferase